MNWLFVGVIFGVLLAYSRYVAKRRSDPARRERKFTPRNLPQVFLHLAFVLGSVGLMAGGIGWAKMAEESDLKWIAGTVEQAPWREYRKGSLRIHIPVKTEDGSLDLDEDNLSHSREIMQLVAGDNIIARVHSVLGDNDLWELTSHGVTIQSYQDSYQYERQAYEKEMTIALCMGTIASILLTVALALRMHFAAWRDPTALALAVPDGSEFAASQDSIPFSSATQNDSGQADAWQPWDPSDKTKCPKCGIRCYRFERQCYKCGAQLRPAEPA